MIPFEQACDELRSCFDVPPEALDRGEAILELQHAALAADPPPRSLPAAAGVAAASRLRSGEPVIPRERWPVEPSRVARLLRILGGAFAPASGLEESAAGFAEAALLPAQSDDARGVLKVAERFGLPPEAGAALLREALKPEMLRLSLPFGELVGDTPRSSRCPACGDKPSAATARGRACCRWCGTTWRWDSRSCGACGKARLETREVARLVHRTSLLQCGACGEALRVFSVSDDALLLSMLAVLTSPLDLAIRIGGEAQPGEGFSVF